MGRVDVALADKPLLRDLSTCTCGSEPFWVTPGVFTLSLDFELIWGTRVTRGLAFGRAT